MNGIEIIFYWIQVSIVLYELLTKVYIRYTPSQLGFPSIQIFIKPKFKEEPKLWNNLWRYINLQYTVLNYRQAVMPFQLGTRAKNDWPLFYLFLPIAILSSALGFLQAVFSLRLFLPPKWPKITCRVMRADWSGLYSQCCWSPNQAKARIYANAFSQCDMVTIVHQYSS